MSREEAQIRSSALSMAFLLRDVLFSLGWFMLVVFLIVVCLVAANAAHRFRMQRPGHIQERQPPIG
jgi:hypothetical protein